MKNGTEKPLGFYIRDGVSVRVTPHGLEKVRNRAEFKLSPTVTVILDMRSSSFYMDGITKRMGLPSPPHRVNTLWAGIHCLISRSIG